MKRISACILALAVGLGSFSGCSGNSSPTFTGSHQVLKVYNPVTPPPKVVGNSTITFDPMLEFPPGTLDIYMACIHDVARLNNVDAGT